MLVPSNDYSEYYNTGIIYVDRSASGFLKSLEEKLWSDNYKGLEGTRVRPEELAELFKDKNDFLFVTQGGLLYNEEDVSFDALFEIIKGYERKLVGSPRKMEWFREFREMWPADIGRIRDVSLNGFQVYDKVFRNGKEFSSERVAYADRSCGSTIVGKPGLETIELSDKGILLYNCGACERTMYVAEKNKLIETPGPF